MFVYEIFMTSAIEMPVGPLYLSYREVIHKCLHMCPFCYKAAARIRDF